MPNSEMQSGQGVPLHPMRVVSQRTGLSSHVLRAWERRYAVVAPTRTEGGQRLYTDADIERLSLLRSLTSQGGAISQLAQLPPAELARLMEEGRAGAGRATAGADPPDRRAVMWRDAALAAVERMHGVELRRRLERGLVSLGVPLFLDQVAGPVLVEIGQRWRAGRMSIAHEHLATAVFRQVLGWVRETAEAGDRAPAVVVATLPRQIHEGGAMLVAAAAACEGWQVVYLGVDLPPGEIGAAARRTGALAVALSLIHPTDDPALGDHLRALRDALPAGLPLLVGGGAAESYRGAIEAVEGEVLSDLPGLRATLAELARAG